MRTAFLAKLVTSFSLSFMNGPLGREILVFLKVRLTLNLALLKMNMVKTLRLKIAKVLGMLEIVLGISSNLFLIN